MDPLTVTLASVAAGAGATAWSVGAWALRLEGRVNAHETADAIVHQNVDQSLADLKIAAATIDGKIDRLVERLIPHA